MLFHDGVDRRRRRLRLGLGLRVPRRRRLEELLVDVLDLLRRLVLPSLGLLLLPRGLLVLLGLPRGGGEALLVGSFPLGLLLLPSRLRLVGGDAVCRPRMRR